MKHAVVLCRAQRRRSSRGEKLVAWQPAWRAKQVAAAGRPLGGVP